MKKKLMLTALSAVALGVVATPSWAFTSVSITTVTAAVTTGGQRVAQFSLAIRNTNNPFGPNVPTIGWSGVTPPTTLWKMSDQLLVINSTVTDAAGGIKIYTDNTAAGSFPRFIDPTPANRINVDSVASGLLVGVATTSVPGLPLAWSIKTSTKIVEGGDVNTGIGASDPVNGSSQAVLNNRFQWLFYTDAYNWQFGVDRDGNGTVTVSNPQVDDLPLALDAPYVTMVNLVGTHFGQAPNEFGAHPDGANSFVYMEANFQSALVQTLYGTSAMRVEAYIQ